MNELIATGPFDLYELQLFHLVAEHRSFTRAAQGAGLTQSAITRQIAGMESRLGVSLFERTTRSVRLTPAGAALFARSGAILGNVDSAIKAVRERFQSGPSTLRLGIARTISLAYLPAFFRAFRNSHPHIQLTATHESSAFILGALEAGELDIGLVTQPPRLSRAIQILRHFTDEFVCIAPPRARLPKLSAPIPLPALPQILPSQKWLSISTQTVTGASLQQWLRKNGLRLPIATETDNFDLLINLVSAGLGCAFVPHRSLAIHNRSRPVQRIQTAPKFTRSLLIAAAKTFPHPELISAFASTVPFGLSNQTS